MFRLSVLARHERLDQQEQGLVEFEQEVRLGLGRRESRRDRLISPVIKRGTGV